jgi:bifunctional non-homologous end joining protein LigD
MPKLRRKAAPTPPANPADWRPQRFSKSHRINDPIVEPMWRGVRVIAVVESGKARFVDEEGVDCTDEFAAIADALCAAARAESLVVDGHLTVEPTQASVGVSVEGPESPGSGRMMAQVFVGAHVADPSVRKNRLDPDRPIAFVAVDLLGIDGQSLLDVPLLERKRLLDGALEQDEIVRITPFVRPPLGTFLNTWRSLGFADTAWKGANSRYYPGEGNDDWAISPMPAR